MFSDSDQRSVRVADRLGSQVELEPDPQASGSETPASPAAGRSLKYRTRASARRATKRSRVSGSSSQSSCGLSSGERRFFVALFKRASFHPRDELTLARGCPNSVRVTQPESDGRKRKRGRNFPLSLSVAVRVCRAASSKGGYGSKGWGFESLGARMFLLVGGIYW